MGGTKDEMLRGDAERGMAAAVLVEFGHLRKCELHEDELIDQLTLADEPEDDDDSPKMVRRLQELGFEGGMAEAWAMFKAAKSDAGDSCGTCGGHADD